MQQAINIFMKQCIHSVTYQYLLLLMNMIVVVAFSSNRDCSARALLLSHWLQLIQHVHRRECTLHFAALLAS